MAGRARKRSRAPRLPRSLRRCSTWVAVMETAGRRIAVAGAEMAATATRPGAAVGYEEEAAASATEAAMGLGEAAMGEAAATGRWGAGLVEGAATAGKAAGSASCR